MATDIGQILFVDILRMSSYPGSPFTGNLFQDLVMMLIVPMVFIILIMYMGVGRILPKEHGKLRVMLGVAAFLFLISSGYYEGFAYFAQAYFIIFIFVIAFLFFVLEHFIGRKPRTTQQTGGPFALGEHGGGGGGEWHGPAEQRFAEMGRRELGEMKARIQQSIKDIDDEIKTAAGATDTRDLKMAKVRLQNELRQIEHQMKFIKV